MGSTKLRLNRTIGKTRPISRRRWFGFSVLLLLGVLGTLSSCSRQKPWNVVLFTFDTTRADFLGCYGKASAKTPYLDALAAEGYLFEHALASNPVTQAAHSTILTGVYPMQHGVRDNLLFRLPEARQTLAERLQEAGYATGAAIGGFPLVRSFGSDQGFDFYDDDLGQDARHLRGLIGGGHRSWYDERPAGHVNDAILPWLRQQLEEDQPFFAWLHYWDPHEPHIPPAPYDQLFGHDLYQGEIAYADQSLGALLSVIETAGELERTVVVMVADHGESRYDHAEATHAYLAYDSTLRVPLIIKVPGQPSTAGRRVAERVATVDIVPTVLDLVGLEPDESLHGRSLKPLMMDAIGAVENRRLYYAESLSPRLSHGVGELRALYRGPYKYIHGPRPELYDLSNDPGEIHDLSAERPEERRAFEAQLQSFLNDHASDAAADAVHQVDDATRQRLEALGYLSTNEQSPSAVNEILSTDGAVPQDRVGDINLAGRLRNQMGAGRFRLALKTAQRLLEGDPENEYYLGRLAAIHLGLGDVDAAVQVVEAAGQVSRANLSDFTQVALALFQQGDEAEGLDLARRLLAAQDTVSGRLLLASMLGQRGDDVAQGQELEAALALEPEHPGALLLQAEFLTETDLLSQAETIFRQLLNDEPLHLRALVGLAEVLRRSGRASEALPHVERVLRLAPRFCRAHLERLEILMFQEETAGIEVGVEDVREMCQGNTEALARFNELIAEEQG